MNTNKLLTTFLASILLAVPSLLPAQNAFERAADELSYNAEAQASVASGNTPLWLQANRHGLSSVKEKNGYLRFGISREAQTDSLFNWRIGYGADLVVPFGHTSKFFVHQLYADFDYKWLRLSVGSKERPLQLKDNTLSSGAFTFGTNARPIPQFRLEIPKYVEPFRKADWLAVKGHFGYGLLTDGNWQQEYLNPGLHHAKKVFYHSKAAYLRLGNSKRFPLTFEGGLEMATTFGGEVFNAQDMPGQNFKKSSGISDFVKAIYGGGSDETDSDYANAGGNTLGSWLARLSWTTPQWGVSLYYDHFFEDHSQLFMEYGWRDGLYGIELTLSKNPIVSNVVYEYITTRDQSGAVYHDHTDAIPDQVSGVDDYYNHALYLGWQHWGQAIGNPLITTSLYANNGTLAFSGNRISAHHLGLKGSPTSTIDYRLLFTYISNWGRYSLPYEHVRHNTSVLCEVNWHPEKIFGMEGWSASLGFAFDKGSLISNNTGAQLTLRKTGWLLK